MPIMAEKYEFDVVNAISGSLRFAAESPEKKEVTALITLVAFIGNAFV